jgi:hypothetical protein
MRPNAVVQVAPDVVLGVLAASTQAAAYIEAFASYAPRSGGPVEQALLGWVTKRPEHVNLKDALALAGLALLGPNSVVDVLSHFYSFGAELEQALALARHPKQRRQLKDRLSRCQLAQAHMLVALFAFDEARFGSITFDLALGFARQSTPVAVRGLWALRATRHLEADCVDHFQRESVLHPSHALTVGIAALIANDSLNIAEKINRLAQLASLVPDSAHVRELVKCATTAIAMPEVSVRHAVEMGRDLYARAVGDTMCSSERETISEQTALATLYAVARDEAHLPTLVSAMPHFLRSPLQGLYLPANVLNGLQRRP